MPVIIARAGPSRNSRDFRAGKKMGVYSIHDSELSFYEILIRLGSCTDCHNHCDCYAACKPVDIVDQPSLPVNMQQLQCVVEKLSGSRLQ